MEDGVLEVRLGECGIDLVYLADFDVLRDDPVPREYRLPLISLMLFSCAYGRAVLFWLYSIASSLAPMSMSVFVMFL